MILFQRTAYALRHKRDGHIALIGLDQPFLQWARPEETDKPSDYYETVKVTVTLTEQKKRAAPTRRSKARSRPPRAQRRNPTHTSVSDLRERRQRTP